MAKWRDIFANRIQTWEDKVWLWDDRIGLSVLVEVPSRPWTKLNDDFTAWCRVEYDADTGVPITPEPIRSLRMKDEVVQAMLADVSEDIPKLILPF